MRTYLVDGSNAVRRGGYDPRFPAVEEARVEAFLLKVEALSAASAGRIEVEVFLDGPRRPLPARPGAPVRVRFPVDGDADAAILGSARRLLNSGRGVVVVTADGGLAADIEAEGGRTMRFGEFLRRLEEGTA
ncbi:MAG: hypothetical protein KGL53_03090 [Elusimicrobia bacterium]|nr:hypothetical protein [Elusimicrobiota bacterium]